MPLTQSALVIKYIKDNLTLDQLKETVDSVMKDSLFSSSVRGAGSSRKNMIKYIGMGTVGILLPFLGSTPALFAAYTGYRYGKLKLRTAGLDNQNANPKEVLLKILTSHGGQDRDSYKWNIVMELTKTIYSQAILGVDLDIGQFCALSYDSYSDVDVNTFIEELKLNLMSTKKKPAQIILILENFIKENKSYTTWYDSEPVRLAKNKLKDMKAHFPISSSSETDESLLANAMDDFEQITRTTNTIKSILTLEISAQSSQDAKDMSAYFERVTGYLAQDQLSAVVGYDITF